MNRLGKYCKAYMIDDLRKFSGWNESAREKAQDATDEAKTAGETDLSNILFVQDNYTVTAGIFLDENVILDTPTPAWIEFCRDTLRFDPAAAIDQSAETARPA